MRKLCQLCFWTISRTLSILTTAARLPCGSVLPTAARTILLKPVRSCPPLLQSYDGFSHFMESKGLARTVESFRISPTPTLLTYLVNLPFHYLVLTVLQHTGESFLSTFHVISWSTPTSTRGPSSAECLDSPYSTQKLPSPQSLSRWP